MADPVTPFKMRGEDWIALVCECGQKQQTPDAGDGKAKCAACGKEHSVNG